MRYISDTDRMGKIIRNINESADTEEVAKSDLNENPLAESDGEEEGDKVNEAAIDKIDTKEKALVNISNLYPGKNNKNAGQWMAYSELVIDLISKFRLSKEEVLKAQKSS